jgi:hypothetical protein
MKNFTFSADEHLIERARATARARRTTLNAAFREWLAQYAVNEGDAERFDTLMKSLRKVNAGKHFSRDEFY